MLKNHEIDKEATLKYIDTTVTDKDWREVYKAAMNVCIPKILEMKDQIQMASSWNTEQCNVVYDGILACVNIVAFAVSQRF